jgi:hypothetical protein
MDTGASYWHTPSRTERQNWQRGQSGRNVVGPHLGAIPDAKLADPASASERQVARASACTKADVVCGHIRSRLSWDAALKDARPHSFPKQPFRFRPVADIQRMRSRTRISRRIIGGARVKHSKHPDRGTVGLLIRWSASG